jgi:hypothetical protein
VAKAKNPLPAALLKRASDQVAAKRRRLAEEARADIDLVRRRKDEVTERFYDMGEALVRLQRPGVAEAIGYGGFGELCEKELAMSASKARQLVAIVRGVRRPDAVKWGQERAAALLALAEATPEPDSAALLAGADYELPSGKTLDVGKAPVTALWDAARELRAARAQATTKRGRGLTTTAEERAGAARLERALHEAGLALARVIPVAKNRAGAQVRIERVPLAEIDKIRVALVRLNDGAPGRASAPNPNLRKGG